MYPISVPNFEIWFRLLYLLTLIVNLGIQSLEVHLSNRNRNSALVNGPLISFVEETLKNGKAVTIYENFLSLDKPPNNFCHFGFCKE